MNGFGEAAGCACLAAAAVLLVALASFGAGRRRGIIEGMRLGEAEALIAARQEALDSGRCPLCATSFERTRIRPVRNSEGPGLGLGPATGDRSLAAPSGTYPLTGGPRPAGGAAGGRSG